MEDRGRNSRTYNNRKKTSARPSGRPASQSRNNGEEDRQTIVRQEDRQTTIRQEDRELRRSGRVCGGEEKDNA
mgnify:CR=1 FL=1